MNDSERADHSISTDSPPVLGWNQLAMLVRDRRTELEATLSTAETSQSSDAKREATEALPTRRRAYREALARVRDAAIAELAAAWEAMETPQMEEKAAGYVAESWRSGV